MTALLEIECESIALAKDVLVFRTFTQIELYSDEIAMSDVRRSIRNILIDCRGFDNQMVDTAIKYYMREYERVEKVYIVVRPSHIGHQTSSVCRFEDAAAGYNKAGKAVDADVFIAGLGGESDGNSESDSNS